MTNVWAMEKNAFYIDKITNSIEDALTWKSFETRVDRVRAPDLRGILKKNGWRFNWEMEMTFPGRQLYKLLIKDDTRIQGLISLQAVENYIEMHLIETAPHNFGHLKKYAGVAGNLVAFACKTSFEASFEGFVAFTAKTQLIQHYIDTLGAQLIFKNRMSLSGNSAKNLVNSYFKNDL